MPHASLALRLPVEGAGDVSALLCRPDDAFAGCVFAHGAGAGMEHPFMADVAAQLAARGVATLRFQFPFMEQGSRRPDPPARAHAAVRAAVAEAASRMPGLPLFAAGKSFGGRMTSQAMAAQPLPGVRALVFFGFPLHAAGKPSDQRAAHLADVPCPMLFLQGTRDALASLDLLRPVIVTLGERATLELIDDADHAFHVRRKVAGRDDAQVLAAMAERAAQWLRATLGGR